MGISLLLQRSLQASKLQALGMSCVPSQRKGPEGHERVRAAVGVAGQCQLWARQAAGCRVADTHLQLQGPNAQWVQWPE